MGHERVGNLPKSKPWRQIVAGVGATRQNPTLINSVASDTLKQVQSRLENGDHTRPATEAFAFLVKLAVAAKSGNAGAAAGKDSEKELTPLSLAVAIRNQVEGGQGHAEHKSIACDAAIDAVGKWNRGELDESARSLFAHSQQETSPWARLGSGAAFSELARLYFSSFTERYLTFFLDREIGATLPIEARARFRSDLHSHLGDVSKHAFETAKIAQSFAAAWFNKNAAGGTPSERQIEAFVRHAFDKIREELRREGGS